MNANRTKSVLGIILIAVVSSVITMLGYDQINKKRNRSLSGNVGEYAGSFEQDNNVILTNLTASQGYFDFTQAAEKSVHGVVHVKTKAVREQVIIDPFDFFFGFGQRIIPREVVGYGSGVIISKDGYIITNNHVIKDAREVSVTLNDDREFTAKVVGTDPQSDIALLKIDGDNFSYIPFGNSDALKVGEWVLAIGNPFNLTSTVTAGIVSAKNRTNIVGENMGLQSFIQVDAAVNPGNSGGALVNVRGELVGINTAIYSETGNFTGYAFAIPISIAGKVAADLKEYGVVQRAVLGIQVPNIEYLKVYDPKRASELAKIQGVVVEDFSDRSPAKAAGIEKGDIIKAINNVPVRNFAELQNQLSRYRPGDKVKVTVERNGSEKTFVVELINMQGSTEIIKRPDALKMLGAEFKKIPDEQKRRLGIKSGVEVSNVTRDGLFYKEGIKKGFIIMRINNVAVDSEDDIADIVASVAARGEDEDKVILIAGFYPPNGRTQYIAIDLSKK